MWVDGVKDKIHIRFAQETRREEPLSYSTCLSKWNWWHTCSRTLGTWDRKRVHGRQKNNNNNNKGHNRKENVGLSHPGVQQRNGKKDRSVTAVLNPNLINLLGTNCQFSVPEGLWSSPVHLWDLLYSTYERIKLFVAGISPWLSGRLRPHQRNGVV